MDHEDGRRFIWLISQSGERITVTPNLAGGELMHLDGSEAAEVELEPYGVTILIHTRAWQAA
jgi:hypothetical protein